MKGERDSLQGITGSPLPKESKNQRYVRIVMACMGIGFFAFVIIAAAWRKFGS